MRVCHEKNRDLFSSLLFASLFADRALACESPYGLSGQPVNVAEYLYNPSTGEWHLTNSWHDPYYENYAPDPDDYSFAIGGPGDPAGPGGGGSDPQPPTQPLGTEHEKKGSAETQNMACLPPTTIIAPLNGPTFGWSNFYRIYGGSGGGLHSRVAAGTIPRRPSKQAQANCGSEKFDRFQSALEDVTALGLAGRRTAFRGRTSVKVTYDDGATERWPTTSPYMSTPIGNEPVEGSLSCND